MGISRAFCEGLPHCGTTMTTTLMHPAAKTSRHPLLKLHTLRFQEEPGSETLPFSKYWVQSTHSIVPTMDSKGLRESHMIPNTAGFLPQKPVAQSPKVTALPNLSIHPWPLSAGIGVGSSPKPRMTLWARAHAAPLIHKELSPEPSSLTPARQWCLH